MRSKVNLLSRKEIRKIAISYALSPFDKTASYYVQVFNISESTFYHCLERAVEESIVDLKTANMIAEKAATNAELYVGKNAKIASYRHYQRLIDARSSFRFSMPERKRLVKKYADSEKSLENFCRQEYIAKSTMTNALKTAIINEEVDNVVVGKLYKKSVKMHGQEKADGLFNKLKIERRAHHDARIQNTRIQRKKWKEQKRINSEIKEIEEQQNFSQLSLEDYISPVDFEPTMDIPENAGLQDLDTDSSCADE